MLTSYTKLVRRCVALLILLSATLPARPRVAPAQGVPLSAIQAMGILIALVAVLGNSGTGGVVHAASTLAPLMVASPGKGAIYRGDADQPCASDCGAAGQGR